jgi:hypothetical protein
LGQLAETSWQALQQVCKQSAQYVGVVTVYWQGGTAVETQVPVAMKPWYVSPSQ